MNKKNIYNKIENKKDYTKIYNFFSFLKVASIVIAALYSVFWFYRFFNLPFTDIIYPVFDFFITPIKQTIETQNTFNGAVIEMGYFIMAVI